MMSNYGEVEKWGEKQSTLTNYFSADFHSEFVKFCKKLSELLKNNGIIFLKKIKKKLGKNAKKNYWGVFLSQYWSQKNSRQMNCFLATLVIPVTRESNGYTKVQV